MGDGNSLQRRLASCSTPTQHNNSVCSNTTTGKSQREPPSSYTLPADLNSPRVISSFHSVKNSTEIAGWACVFVLSIKRDSSIVKERGSETSGTKKKRARARRAFLRQLAQLRSRSSPRTTLCTTTQCRRCASPYAATFLPLSKPTSSPCSARCLACSSSPFCVRKVERMSFVSVRVGDLSEHQSPAIKQKDRREREAERRNALEKYTSPNKFRILSSMSSTILPMLTMCDCASDAADVGSSGAESSCCASHADAVDQQLSWGKVASRLSKRNARATHLPRHTPTKRHLSLPTRLARSLRTRNFTRNADGLGHVQHDGRCEFVMGLAAAFEGFEDVYCERERARELGKEERGGMRGRRRTRVPGRGGGAGVVRCGERCSVSELDFTNAKAKRASQQSKPAA